MSLAFRGNCVRLRPIAGFTNPLEKRHGTEKNDQVQDSEGSTGQEGRSLHALSWSNFVLKAREHGTLIDLRKLDH
jgi:hypothetical protein